MSKRAIKGQDESTKLAAESVSNLRMVTAFSSLEKNPNNAWKNSIRPR